MRLSGIRDTCMVSKRIWYSMSTPLFQKTAVFGDIHFGDKSDSPTHNQDCIAFIEWFCEQAKTEKVDLIIFLGDWFDNRSRLRLDTIKAGDDALRMLRDVAPVIMIVGNHDMYYRENRSIHSIDAYQEWDNVTVINECTVMGDVGFVPYLVGTEYLEVLDMNAKYLFGHFELPRFLMNSSIECRDHGQFNFEQFNSPEIVFSGHFHKRQLKINKSKTSVWYIGNPFGHDFNDVNDKERGMMVLEWDQEPRFIDWENGPLYQRFKTSEILDLLEHDTIGQVTRSTSILEVKDDMDLELEDISVIREELSNHVREARVYETASGPQIDDETHLEEMDNKSLDDIVVGHLSQIDPRDSNIKPDMLIKLFQGTL